MRALCCSQEWKSGKRAVELEATTSPFLGQIAIPADSPPDMYKRSHMQYYLLQAWRQGNADEEAGQVLSMAGQANIAADAVH